MVKNKLKVKDTVVVIKLATQGNGSYNRFLFKKGVVTHITDWKRDGITVQFESNSFGRFEEQELLKVNKNTDLKMVKLLYESK